MAKTFKDEVRIDGKVVLNIPIENFFHEDRERRFETKWSEPVESRAKKGVARESRLTPDGFNKETVSFDPLKALIYKDKYLAITSKEHHQQGYRRPSRWAPPVEKSFHPVPLNVIPRNLNLEEVEYLIRLHRLDDLKRKTRQGTLEVVDPEVRSQSPDPVYDTSGKRVNTLENRVKSAMLAEKHYLVEECQKMNVGFLTPFDWKPLKKTRKVLLPEIEDPELNFVAIVLGPKGRTQKLLEELSNCRISVRGRLAAGSKRTSTEDEEQTHVLVQAETDEELEKGAEMVLKVLRGESLQSIAGGEKKYIKTGHHLVAVESVLRDFCENCKEEGHKIRHCPYSYDENQRRRMDHMQKQGAAGPLGLRMLVCDTCGKKDHLARDCPHKHLAAAEQSNYFNMEYYKMMNELNGAELEVEDLKPGTGTQLTNFITNAPSGDVGRKMIKDK